MKIDDLVPSEIVYNGLMSLTDFLNYAILIGHNVRDDELHWINEYMEYASSWKQSNLKNF